MVVMFATMLLAARADAFCGFYASGAGGDMYNEATVVVLMREGTRTVLSMQNHYRGPPQDFAMVVPVPVVLEKDDVKALPDAVFDRIDRISAPRLVEYWEENPCWETTPRRLDIEFGGGGEGGPAVMTPGASAKSPVRVEAEFTVGEYDVVILGADDAAKLRAWLRDHDYQIPNGAEELLRPYVQQGMKFFVAKVDVAKLAMKQGSATLSPLRFHYDSELFSLPVRLGLLNARGKQDLIVHILARGQGYEVVNYDNVTVPTNVDLPSQAKSRFGHFYVALFDEVLRRNPRAVVTEYAWPVTTCDSCSAAPLYDDELEVFGNDVIPPTWKKTSFVLTRLHARYEPGQLTEDLVFRKAPPIRGGQEWKRERVAKASTANRFQARYAIRHPWTGPVRCQNPVRNRWGRPWPSVRRDGGPRPARNLAFVSRRLPLRMFADPRVAADKLVSKGDPMGILGAIGTVPELPAAPPSASATVASSAAASSAVMTAEPPASISAPLPAEPQVPLHGQAPAPPVAPPDQGCGSCEVGRVDPKRRRYPGGWLMALGIVLQTRRRALGRLSGRRAG